MPVNNEAMYLTRLVEAIPEGYGFFQIALLRYLVTVTNLVHAYEYALNPDSPQSIPIDPHGFPQISHMRGSLSFALDRYNATEIKRKQNTAVLLDTLILANPTQITAVSDSFQAGLGAEEMLLACIVNLTPEQRAFITDLQANTTGKPSTNRPLISYDINHPGILQVKNTENPFNTPKNGIPRSRYTYSSTPQATAALKYLPPLSSEYRKLNDPFVNMLRGALLVLSENDGPQFLHLFNTAEPLTNFDLRQIRNTNSYVTELNLEQPSSIQDSRNLPLFALIKNLPPELLERLTLVDFRDITEEEQRLFYLAIQEISNLCYEISQQFELYISQKISDTQLAIFLKDSVAAKISKAFDPLTTDRLRIELQNGFATVLQRIKKEKGLAPEPPPKIQIATAGQTASLVGKESPTTQKGPGLWDKFRKALS